jgi:hypothetical protein
MGVKGTAKKILPYPVWKAGSDAYWGWHNRGRHLLARSLSPLWRKSQAQVRSYHDRHRGERCFIIGNGPSLRQMDLSLLRNEFTFGLNRIYLMFPELGFLTNYLVVVNELVLEQTAADLRSLRLPKFITWRARRWLSADPGAIFLDTDFTGPENFTTDMSGRIFEGFTVTYVALQLAFYMGFQEAVLIGVDHNYATQGTPNTTVVSQGADPNHFAPGYFGKGFRWQLPDLEGSERAYRMARAAYERAGRQVVDATMGGKLTVFPKLEYASLVRAKAEAKQSGRT